MSKLFLNTKLGKSLIRQKNLLDPVKLFIRIGNEDQITELVIALNTEGKPTSQLFESGIDSQGISLEDIGGSYSPKTIEIKLEKGQPFDRVTLKDEGGFYDSFEVKADSTGFVFFVDPIKGDTNLFDEWGEDIVGLIPENLRIVIIVLVSRYIQETRKIILGA